VNVFVGQGEGLSELLFQNCFFFRRHVLFRRHASDQNAAIPTLFTTVAPASPPTKSIVPRHAPLHLSLAAAGASYPFFCFSSRSHGRETTENLFLKICRLTRTVLETATQLLYPPRHENSSTSTTACLSWSWRKRAPASACCRFATPHPALYSWFGVCAGCRPRLGQTRLVV
jgi:hypothetical protein